MAGRKLFRHRFIRWPCALLTGCATTFVFSRLWLHNLYHNDLTELGLDRYFDLDLNADMMKADLQELGISISAKHFNMEEAQRRADQELSIQQKAASDAAKKQ